MRRFGWLILGLVGIGCIDLTEPPELRPPTVSPGVDPDAATSDSGVLPVVADASADGSTKADAMAIREDGPAAKPDQAAWDAPPTVGADAGAPVDSTGAPDAAVDAPQSATPDAATPEAPAPDAFVAPDLTPDTAPDTTPDVSPDTTPDTNVEDTAATPPVDATPEQPPLVIDDFQTSPVLTRNNLNSDVTWDNQNCTRMNGEMACSWNGQLNYQDFIETINQWCAFDGRAYTKLRFRMRASAAGKLVNVYVSLSTGSCPGQQKPAPLVGTVTTTTTMTTYEFDITGIARERMALIELGPRTVDSTQYVLDDLQLVP